MAQKVAQKKEELSVKMERLQVSLTGVGVCAHCSIVRETSWRDGKQDEGGCSGQLLTQISTATNMSGAGEGSCWVDKDGFSFVKGAVHDRGQ